MAKTIKPAPKLPGKRGPKPGIIKGSATAVIEALGIDTLCERLRSGESITHVARSLKIDPGTVLNWLAADVPRSARARDARSAAATMYDEMADDLIEHAKDPFELSKAKERAFHLRWRASKVNPASYGDRVAVRGDEDGPPIKLGVVIVPAKS